MFNRKKIEELQNIIKEMECRQNIIFDSLSRRIDRLQDESKQKYMWEIRQEEISDIIDGKKIKKIRKILE
jgi:predicted oxidoreductase (fatty acid repression mutant protein)